MRNFYIRTRADGAADKTSGPVGPKGGADVSVYVKQAGESVCALDVLCRVNPAGGLTVKVLTARGQVVHVVNVAG